MNSLDEIIGESLQKFTTHLSRVADKMGSCGLTAEEQEDFLEKSKQVIAQGCILDLEHQADLPFMKKTEDRFVQNDNEKTPEEIFQDLKKEQGDVEHDFEDHEIYQNMLENINEARQIAGLGGNGNQSRAGEDGFLVSDVQISTIDPISKCEMKNPFKSQQCGHSFERNSILALLKKKHSIRCPIGGCGHVVTEADLVPDHQMKRFIERRMDQD